MNIVEMIENTPIIRLSGTYQHRLLEKLQERFTENEQQMFVASFYGYLNYNSRTDYVIDLDTIWKWCGFSQKVNAKKLLKKHFIKNKDYECLLCQLDEQTNGRGGHNKEKIMLTINAFKLFCMKAGTKKAEEIHEYYMKLEETLHEVINEECSQLREEIEEKTKMIENNEVEKRRLREKTILEQFPNNVQCIYYGIIENKTQKDEPLIKFGHSNYLRERVERHKKTFTDFCLINAYKVENKLQIENAIKTDPILKTIRRTISINDIIQTELLSIEHYSLDEIDKKIKEIIQSIEFNPENYKKILHENIKLKREYTILLDKYNILCKQDGANTTKNTIAKHVRKYKKHKDGYYYIYEIKYEKLTGTRDEVWQNIAYRTTGGLIKDELLENHNGKIISKNKHIDSINNNHLAAYNSR
jgi:phage anti-repressor protein